jgi:LysR family transcriptional regulator, low CO2-responsive transcriptional regulator
MTPSQARAFHAVAVEGSFTAAARFLSVSQPSVSNQVKQLERAYKVDLFHRSSRGVKLTPAGEELLAILRRMFGSFREAVEFLQETEGLRRGHLRVGSYGPYAAVEMMAAFKSRYQDIQISLSLGNSRDLEQRLLTNELDVGVFTRTDAQADFYELPYCEPPAVAIVPYDPQWKGRRSISVAELLRYDLIRRERGSAVRTAADLMLAQHGALAHRAIDMGSREGVVSAVSHGMGGALIFDEGFFPSDRVVKLPFEDFKACSHVSAICLAERKSSRIISAFLSIAKEFAETRRQDLGSADHRAAGDSSGIYS